jgi:molybdopterin-containing oxidoreductase family membrane subunit
MWHHGMMPIRFITTAFAAGPSLIILIFLFIRNNTRLWIENEAIDMLSAIITYCLGIALFLTLSEVVTEFYANAEHALGMQYLMFGVNGLDDLVPWFWSSLAANVIAFVMLLIPRCRKNYRTLALACVLVFCGIWIEKGMGLLIPGFIPSPIGEFSQYFPTSLEVMVTLGNWAVGFLILTILLKGSIGVLLGEVVHAGRPAAASVGAGTADEATALGHS